VSRFFDPTKPTAPVPDGWTDARSGWRAQAAGDSLGAIELTTHESIREIGRDAWDGLVGPNDPPFVRWDFLDALEQTGCVDAERGWVPLHFSLRRHGELVGVVPAYVKGHSQGEFVFDHSWAHFSKEKLGVDYYPKLVVAIPFTPVAGPRLLHRNDSDASALYAALAVGQCEIVARAGLSSSHVLFPQSEEASALGDAGMLPRLGVQYHWHNAGYQTFDEFLARFKSKRRNQIRRERRELERQGTILETLSGTDLTAELIDWMFEFYRATIGRYYWGRQYLNRDFFHELCSRMPEQVLVVLARDASSRKPIAGALNLMSSKRLFGRYWGALEERRHLHFNVCYYQGIDECIRRGLASFSPGAGGEHKLARGFEPTLTHSAHFFRDHQLDAVIRDFLTRERRAVAAHLAEYRASPLLKSA
jgi:predicted N-acyltransferase